MTDTNPFHQHQIQLLLYFRPFVALKKHKFSFGRYFNGGRGKFKRNKYTMEDITFTRAQCSTQYGIGVQKNNAKKQKRRKKKLPKNISCENCSQKFATRIQLHAHEAQRQSDSKWECCVCERLYSSKRLLIEHLTSHYPQEAIFKCPVRDCDKAFFYEGNLNRHLDTHGRFRCMDPTCIGRGKKFATRNNLDSHTRRHLNILTERCIICNKYYADKRALNSHKTTKIHQKLAKERQHQNRSNLTMQNQN